MKIRKSSKNLIQIKKNLINFFSNSNYIIFFNYNKSINNLAEIAAANNSAKGVALSREPHSFGVVAPAGPSAKLFNIYYTLIVNSE